MKRKSIATILLLTVIIVLAVLPVSAFAECGTELVINGDIENGATGWTVSGNVSFVGGTMAFNEGDTTPNGIVSQAMTGEPNKRHALSFDYRRDGIGLGTDVFGSDQNATATGLETTTFSNGTLDAKDLSSLPPARAPTAERPILLR